MKRRKENMRLGVVMDPIGSIAPHTDSTLPLLLEAQARGWGLEYMELGDLRIREGVAEATTRPLGVRDDGERWYDLGDAAETQLGELDIVLMRKDPPVDVEYFASTHVLELAEAQGPLVVNGPRGLRDVGEKAWTGWWPDFCPPGLLTRSMRSLREFLAEHGTIVLKPLNAMGGRSVFVVRSEDLNQNVIFEEMTRRERRFIQAQAYNPEIATTGDKRILLVDGKPVPHAIARTPPEGDQRANITRGASFAGCQLTDRDRRICDRIGPALVEKGLFLVGIDVIGDQLTEINVTSPTGLREIDRIFGINVAATFWDAMEKRLDP